MEYIDRNQNRLAPRVYSTLAHEGIVSLSRNGPVLRHPGVVTLISLAPRERVNFCPLRDANPFFHLVEAMAMLAPLNDVELMAYLASNMRSYSDDGERYNAFYGERLRVTWGDQLGAVINELSERPGSRQAVAQIWDVEDLDKETKDKACNLALLFDVQDGKLHMTSLNRSNDAIWGILSGANVVHLSFFQEYVACALGLDLGPWTHVSNNLHVYTDNPKWEAMKNSTPPDYYVFGTSLIKPGPLLFDQPHQRLEFDVSVGHVVKAMAAVARSGDAELLKAMRDQIRLPFLREVVVPAFLAWHARKTGGNPHVWLAKIMARDWHMACTMWVNRRAKENNPS